MLHSALTYGYEIIRQDLQPQVIVGGLHHIFLLCSLYGCDTKKINMTANSADYKIYGRGIKAIFRGRSLHAHAGGIPDSDCIAGQRFWQKSYGYGKSSSNSYFNASQLDDEVRYVFGY
jgi:hypothetical protein